MGSVTCRTLREGDVCNPRGLVVGPWRVFACVISLLAFSTRHLRGFAFQGGGGGAGGLMTSGFATSSEHVYHVGHVLMVNFAAWHGHADGPSCQREGGWSVGTGGMMTFRIGATMMLKDVSQKKPAAPSLNYFVPKPRLKPTSMIHHIFQCFVLSKP